MAILDSSIGWQSVATATPRIPDASKQLLEEYLTTHYASPLAKRAAAVYRLYREECEKQGIAPIGERTFYRERARFTSQEVTTLRRGKRAAYVSQPFFYYLDQTTPDTEGVPLRGASGSHRIGSGSGLIDYGKAARQTLGHLHDRCLQPTGAGLLRDV